MRIGELAQEVGVSTDTVRFYERSGWLPRASRRDNAYRDYGDADVDHLRLIIDRRRLDLPLEDAARIAGWCHSGHCADSTAELPHLIEARRHEIADRIAGLQGLAARLAGLLGQPRRRRSSRWFARAPRPAAPSPGGPGWAMLRCRGCCRRGGRRRLPLLLVAGIGRV